MILVLVKAITILEFLAKTPNKEIPLSDIANSLGMDRGTCANILKTLCARGYAQQSGPRQGYKLGYMAYNLTNSDINNDFLTKVAREDVERLGASLNECILLSVIRNDKRVVLLRSEPDRSILARANIDKSVYGANSGRVILANYTPNHMEQFIIRKGLPTKEEWPEIYHSGNPSGELMNDLAEIRRNGYSIQIDASHEVTGFSAPLFRDNHVVGSICAYLPSFRVDKNSDAILQKVLDCAKEINRKIALTDEI